jgi:hypothetical protein
MPCHDSEGVRQATLPPRMQQKAHSVPGPVFSLALRQRVASLASYKRSPLMSPTQLPAGPTWTPGPVLESDSNLSQLSFPAFPQAPLHYLHGTKAKKDCVGQEFGMVHLVSNRYTPPVPVRASHHLIHPEPLYHVDHDDPFHPTHGTALPPRLKLADFNVAAVLELTPADKVALKTGDDFFCVAFHSVQHAAWVVPIIPLALHYRFVPCSPHRTVLRIDAQGPFTQANASDTKGKVTLFLRMNGGAGILQWPNSRMRTTPADHHLGKSMAQYSAVAVSIKNVDCGAWGNETVYEVLEWWDFKAFEWHDAHGNPPFRRGERPAPATK